MNVTASLVYNELTSRGVSVRHQYIGDGNFFAFMYRNKLRTMTGLATDLAASTSRTICNNKDITALVADMLDVGVPATSIFSADDTAYDFLAQHKTIVVKPADSTHGKGISTNVITREQLIDALRYARRHSVKGEIVLQQQVGGRDYRLLVIDGEVVAVAERQPASVIGDGTRSCAELIAAENQRLSQLTGGPQRSINYINMQAAEFFLGTRINDVPAKHERMTVIGTANISAGGRSINRTHQVPAAMVEEAQRLTQAVGAFVCGVDYMYDQQTGRWYMIELNSSPGFELHHYPAEGEAVNVTRLFIDRLLARYDSQAID